MAIEGGVMFALISAMIYFPLILKRPKYQKRVLDLKTNKYEVKQVSSFLYIDAVCGTVPLGQFIGR
jgi:phosphatidylglycerol:prolipoprotein diacylglycerol transferase